MEDAVAKTIAGFLNTDGGTLFIGVNDQREPIGLAHDAALVKPPNADGFVNWLTTHLIGALTHTAVMRTRMRIDAVDGVEICRVDAAASSAPVTARMSDRAEAFWVRMNNSTRALPEIEIEDYVRDRWGARRDSGRAVDLDLSYTSPARNESSRGSRLGCDHVCDVACDLDALWS